MFSFSSSPSPAFYRQNRLVLTLILGSKLTSSAHQTDDKNSIDCIETLHVRSVHVLARDSRKKPCARYASRDCGNSCLAKNEEFLEILPGRRPITGVLNRSTCSDMLFVTSVAFLLFGCFFLAI
jgi:hypothetical protein